MTLESSDNPLEDQLIYKLGSLETLIVHGMKSINEKLSVLATTMAEHRQESAAEAEEIKLEINRIKDRVTKLENWKISFRAKITGAFIIITAVWTLFSKSIQSFITGASITQ